MKNLIRNLCLLALIVFFIAYLPAQAEAVFNPPTFPVCTNPQGSIIADFPTGDHAIVGLEGLKSGSDKVFNLENGNTLQCFCPPDNGSGIQTDWLEASQISDVDKIDLQTKGWVLIPNGADWGLKPVPYLAKNSSFSCSGGGSSNGGGGSSGGGGGVSTPTCTDATPKAPHLMSVVKSGSSATLKWDKQLDANDYSIVYGFSFGNWLYGVPSTGNVDNFTINGLDPNANYVFAIRAINVCQPSSLSTLGGSGGIMGEVLGISTLAPTSSDKAKTNAILTFVLGILLVLFGLNLKRGKKYAQPKKPSR